ncbi:hypothetical protein KKG61_08710 [bacterium]|nr:hypothetical protein [bacterium]MBU1600162.1 hypothetical protein [bacterium]MBU2461440.1 hypothetical protein [bacterium]
MIVCKKCGYENIDSALYCNLCKELFHKKEKRMTLSDLPPEIQSALDNQKKKIEEGFIVSNLFRGVSQKKLWTLAIIIGAVIILFLLFFLLSRGK